MVPFQQCTIALLFMILLVLNATYAASVEDELKETAVDTEGNFISDSIYNERRNIALLRALGGLAHEIPAPIGKSIAVGWNANVDMVVNGCDLVRRDFPIPTPRDVKMITSLDDFADSFAYWFEKGAAAERLVETPELFKQILELALEHSEKMQYKTGGNAALMATALAADSCQCRVLLGGQVGPRLHQLLSPNIRTVVEIQGREEGEEKEGSAASEDAIHLILEYRQGDEWGGVTAPRHNRFIVVHDEYNANIGGLEALAEQMRAEVENGAEPHRVFIASGLNQLEGLVPEARESRLSAVAKHLNAIPAFTPVHLELASMVHRDFLLRMFSSLVLHSDSLGLNEEELAMLYEVLGGTYAASDSSSALTRSMLTGRVPEPRAVGLALQFVWEAVENLHSRTNLNLRLLSRIHFHCLSFHIISVRRNPSVRHWSDRMDVAVSRGAMAAVEQACALPLEGLTEPLFDVLAPATFAVPGGEERSISAQSPVAVWTTDAHIFHLAPVPVCKHPKNTVGLGDAISANALVYSLA